jgi:DNA (cytosine-5)-methyltransferase 1
MLKANDLPDHELLAAGFSCQPFSRAGRLKGFSDPRGNCFGMVASLVSELGECRPRVLLFENVRFLAQHDAGRTLAVMLGTLDRLGYTASWEVLNAKDFGVPQNRERIIIVASVSGRVFDFGRLRRSAPVVLRDILEKDGEFDVLDPVDYTVLEKRETSRSGLVFAGYRNKATRVTGVRPNTSHLSRAHKQPNRIYDSSGVHPTLSAGESSGRYFVRLDDGTVRRLTVTECYRLMGFPESFRRSESLTSAYRQVGNSVCVPMFAEIGREVLTQLFDGAAL